MQEEAFSETRYVLEVEVHRVLQKCLGREPKPTFEGQSELLGGRDCALN